MCLMSFSFTFFFLCKFIIESIKPTSGPIDSMMVFNLHVSLYGDGQEHETKHFSFWNDRPSTSSHMLSRNSNLNS
jgi:hypothetical protein